MEHLLENDHLEKISNHSKIELVYNKDADTSLVQNVMLIASSVSSYQLFIDSANADTFPIVYSYSSDTNELLQLLQSKFTNIKRICFVFHDPVGNTKLFLDSKPFFTNDDLVLGQNAFSDNVVFLKNLIIQFSITNVDFLACNSLVYDNWKTFYQLLTSETNVIVGASDNLSGNINYGADWMMENTNTDIRNIYFNDSIDNFSGYLTIITINGINYTLNANNTATVTGTTITILDIPATINYNNIVYNVTSIGNDAFKNKPNLTSVVIPDSVTSIGNYAFEFCTSLTSVTIGDNVTTIGIRAFRGTSLTSVTIPDGVTSIGRGVFYQCTSLTSVTIGNSVITIGDTAFKECTKLTSVTIPDSVITIGSGVFQDCTSLTSVAIGNSVTTIGSYAFYQCTSLTSVTIGNSVTSIGNDAFRYCTKLTSVTIPNSVTSIGGVTFFNCTNLMSVFIVDSTKITTVYANSFTDLRGTDLRGTPSYTGSIIKFGNTEASLSGNWTTIKNYYETKMFNYSFPNITGVVAGTSDYTVDITGTNFLDITSVFINDQSISNFIINDNTSITATLDNLMKISSVIVTNSFGDTSNIIQLEEVDEFYPRSISIPISPICFPTGTPILTDQGIVPIEKINTKFHTISNKMIVAVTQTITNESMLVCIDKNALGNNVPNEKTILSMCHAVFYNDKMVQARDLVKIIKNNKNVYFVKYNNELLYNILMEKHEKMSVNNMIVETLHPENIIAKLYSNNYSEREKNDIIVQINKCMKTNDFNKWRSIRKNM